MATSCPEGCFLVHRGPGDEFVVVGLLDELLAQDLLGQQVPPVLEGGVLDIVDGLEEGGSLALQGHLLFSPSFDDLLAVQQFH